MADKKITELIAVTIAAENDPIAIVDTGVVATRKITRQNLLKVQNNLTSTSIINPLSANQGRLLDISKAPIAANYWVSQSDTDLTNEVDLGALTSGLLKHTVAAGVSTPATAIAGTDYLTDLIQDTTPQLGGDLDSNSHNIQLVDGDKLEIGTGHDGEIYSGSDDVYIKNVTQDKDIIFNINDGGTDTEVMRIFADASTVGRVQVTTPNGYPGVVISGGAFKFVRENGAVAAVGEVYSDTASHRPQFIFRRARGTEASPTPVISGNLLFNINSYAQHTAGSGNTSNQGRISSIATENWSSTNKGLEWTFEGTDTGSAAKEEWVTLKDSRLNVVADEGLTVGAGADLDISVVSDDVVVKNVTQDKDIIFQVNDGGTTKTPFRLYGATGYVAAGIIASTPAVAFEVQGPSSTDARARVIETTNNVIMDFNAGASRGFIGTASNHSLRLKTNENSKVEIDTSGNFELLSGTMTINGNLYANLSGGAIGANPQVWYDTTTKELSYDTSALKYKENIRDLKDTDWIYKLRPVVFDENGSTGSPYKRKNMAGLIAEEVEKVKPDMVFYKPAKKTIRVEKESEDGEKVLVNKEVDDLDNMQLEGVGYQQLIVPMLKEIQNLKKEIEKLKAR